MKNHDVYSYVQTIIVKVKIARKSIINQSDMSTSNSSSRWIRSLKSNWSTYLFQNKNFKMSRMPKPQHRWWRCSTIRPLDQTMKSNRIFFLSLILSDPEEAYCCCRPTALGSTRKLKNCHDLYVNIAILSLLPSRDTSDSDKWQIGDWSAGFHLPNYCSLANNQQEFICQTTIVWRINKKWITLWYY